MPVSRLEFELAVEQLACRLWRQRLVENDQHRRWRFWGGTVQSYWLNLDLARHRKPAAFIVDTG